jgi:hypothetical protein
MVSGRIRRRERRAQSLRSTSRRQSAVELAPSRRSLTFTLLFLTPCQDLSFAGPGVTVAGAVVSSRYSATAARRIYRNVRATMSHFTHAAVSLERGLGDASAPAGRCPPAVTIRVPSEALAAIGQARGARNYYGADRVKLLIMVLGETAPRPPEPT